MANGELKRAQVGLALASAFVVLLGSGVAISRISDGEDDRRVATGPTSTSSSLPGQEQPGPATSSGPASSADTGGVAEQPAAASGAAGSEESAVGHGVTRTGRKPAGDASTTSGSSAAAAGTSTGSATGSAAGSPGAPGSGGSPPGSGGEQEPPAPRQVPPEKTPLATAHVSAGEGAQGAVVGVDLANDEPAEADVTVGTNQLVGDHPPSDGTGVDFGGRLFIYPPSPASVLT